MDLETISLIWAAITGILELAKRVIPGTKDDRQIVRILDIGGKVMTLGASGLFKGQGRSRR